MYINEPQHDGKLAQGIRSLVRQPCELSVSRYADGNLAIALTCSNTHEPYASLTINIIPLPSTQAAVDTNNLPYAEEFIERYKLGENTHKKVKSGYCEYPIYDFSATINNPAFN